jgi:hypothetical protein
MNAYEYLAQLRVTDNLSISQLLKVLREGEAAQKEYTIVYCVASGKRMGQLRLMTIQYGVPEAAKRQADKARKRDKALHIHRIPRRFDDNGTMPVTDAMQRNPEKQYKSLLLTHVLFFETFKIIN